MEKHKRKPEALRGWCIYWTVMALYTAGTQVSDRFVFWLPMYSEAKVAFVVYLWHPRTQGALYVYDAFVAPFLARHETAIDRHIDETRVSVGDVIARRARAAVEFAREKFAAHREEEDPKRVAEIIARSKADVRWILEKYAKTDIPAGR